MSFIPTFECVFDGRKKKMCREWWRRREKKNDVHQPHQTQRKSATIFKMVRDRQEREKEKEKKTLIGLAGRTLYVCVCMFVFFVFLIWNYFLVGKMFSVWISQPPPSVGETQRWINNERRLQLLMSNPSCMYTTHVNVVHRGDAGAADRQTHKRRRRRKTLVAAGLTKKNGGGAKFVRRTKKNHHRQNLQKRTGHNSHFEVSDMPQLLLPRCHYSSPAPSPIHLPIMHKHEVPLSFSAPQTIKYIFVFFLHFY